MKPQLVLLDVYLPDMQGTELVTYIRHHLHDTDIIMITAASETDVVRHAAGGVTDYIVKPLMLIDLRRVWKVIKKDCKTEEK